MQHFTKQTQCRHTHPAHTVLSRTLFFHQLQGAKQQHIHSICHRCVLLCFFLPLKVDTLCDICFSAEIKLLCITIKHAFHLYECVSCTAGSSYKQAHKKSIIYYTQMQPANKKRANANKYR